MLVSIFVDFLFEPDNYLSMKLNQFVLQMVEFTLVGFWPKMYLVGVGGFHRLSSRGLRVPLLFSFFSPAKCD